MSSMAKQNQEPARGGFWAELFQFGFYKPNQGRVVRQVSFAIGSLLAVLAAWEILRSGVMGGLGGGRYFAMIGLAAVGVWFAFRMVNYSLFADFLIAVEAEMNKVSWPTRRELWNASLVVMFVIFAMAAFLFLFDALWTAIFEAVGIRYTDGEPLMAIILRWFGLA